MTINLTVPQHGAALQPRITVIGVGGAGGNAVNNMISAQLDGVEFLVANTDSQSLAQSLADRKIQLGHQITNGLGAGSRPEIGRASAEEAIDELGAVGVQLNTNVSGKPLDLPDFEPIFAKMADADLPIWVHPTRTPAAAEYLDEPRSYYDMWWAFGWPFETSVAMGRIVFSGMFDRYPGLKVITHHMGAMVPYFENRVGPGLDALGERSDDPIDGAALTSLKKTPAEYFRMFYGDTALFGAVGAMRCGLDYFGADHVLFGTDMPFVGHISDTLDGIAQLNLDDTDKHAIMEGNARRLLSL